MRGLNGHTFRLFVGQGVGTNPHPRKRVGDFTNKIQIISKWWKWGKSSCVTKKKKNPLYQNEGWEPIHQKYKANESRVDTTQRKNESEQLAKNKEKKPYANRIQGYEMTINDNREDLR
jgi:hypothetical protein